MNFQDLLTVGDADFYLDIAFKKAISKMVELRASLPSTNRFLKSKGIEIDRIKIISQTLSSSLLNIVKAFPNLEDLPEFYKQLIQNDLGIREIRQSLAAVNWAADKIKQTHDVYDLKLKRCQEPTQLNQIRREFSGRASSVIKQINKNLKYLELSRKTMKGYPAIKENAFTVCIVGFPNVGKSTLLSKLTPSKPKIASYAFTTQGLNIGYMQHRFTKIQFVDTPGTLNRFEKFNQIEMQAYLAQKYCANLIVYVFDLTEASSPLSDQKKLYEKTKEFDKPMLIYLSKTDLTTKEQLDNFKKVYYNLEELKAEVIKLVDSSNYK